MKTLRVTLDLTVEDVSKEEKKEAAREIGCALRDVPGLDDCIPLELAGVLESVVGNDEAFAGSGVYVRFSDCNIVSAEFSDSAAPGQSA